MHQACYCCRKRKIYYYNDTADYTVSDKASPVKISIIYLKIYKKVFTKNDWGKLKTPKFARRSLLHDKFCVLPVLQN